MRAAHLRRAAVVVRGTPPRAAHGRTRARGPPHPRLAVLAPPPPQVYTGAYWGLGHGIGAMFVGALGYAVKGWLNLDTLAQWGEVAVGLSILVIGVLGLSEARQWRQGDPDAPQGMAATSAIAAGEAVPVASLSHTSSLLTGVIHGCSGSGHLLGVLPALAMPSLRCASAYLAMFGLGARPARAELRAPSARWCSRRLRLSAVARARASASPRPAFAHAHPRARPSSRLSRHAHALCCCSCAPRPLALAPEKTKQNKITTKIKRRHDAGDEPLHRGGRRNLGPDGAVARQAGPARAVRRAATPCAAPRTGSPVRHRL